MLGEAEVQKAERRLDLLSNRWTEVDAVAVVRDADDGEIERLTRNVHYSGGAVRAELVRDVAS